jgi:hypothetical protein
MLMHHGLACLLDHRYGADVEQVCLGFSVAALAYCISTCVQLDPGRVWSGALVLLLR